MDRVKELKEKGNEFYALGVDDDNKENLVYACKKYAEAIEHLLAYESTTVLSDVLADSVSNLKISLFSNLAAANLKLSNWEGCRRCCNVAVLFCNQPRLKLCDMGLEEDLTVDVQPASPYLPVYEKNLYKILFRRASCLSNLLLLGEAESDLVVAKEIAVRTKSSTAEIEHLLDKIFSMKQDDASSRNSSGKMEGHSTQSNNFMLSEATISGLTVNGSKCFKRKGYWSQTIDTVRVILPLQALLIASKLTDECAVNKLWKVDFTKADLSIHLNNELVTAETLEYNVKPTECYWMLEELGENTGSRLSKLCLVLYLHKTKSVEWFPGCEWWDRVFMNDEPIDTLTCTIDTDESQLPAQAVSRRDAEHARFSELSLQEKCEELNKLSNLKEEFNQAERRVRDEAQAEDAAIEAVPERAEMLSDLRSEFPHIQFTAK